MTEHGAFISPHRNQWMAYALTGLVALMVGGAYASVPLYSIFCKVTGYGGTTQRAADNPKGVIAREMTVSFDDNIAAGLPWTVVPAQPLTAKIGTVNTAIFTATNHSNKEVTGMAVFNVTPELTGSYFNKIQCFCFTQQTLKAGETVQMPVIYFVDPDIDKNDDLHTVKNITLSYTFYEQEKKGS